MIHFKQILETIQDVKVIDASIDYKDYVALDLSAKNTNLIALDVTDAVFFEEFIENHLTKNNAKVAYGGYCEVRNLYQRSSTFKNNVSDERNIHIGLDLWVKAGTPVLAALDGKVHSFQNNISLGDYGPTIILEHQIENFIFHTLYGHLSLESLTDLSIGMEVKKGNQIGTLGDHTVNGDYAPHLHFQIIKDMQDKKGDYPGVSSQKDLDFFIENCPNPNLLLKI